MKNTSEQQVVFIALQKNTDPKAPNNERFPKNISVPTIARIYDKDKERERIIQYTKGQHTIFLDEMSGEPKPAPSKEPIMIRDGILILNHKEKTLIEFLKRAFLKGNTDLLDGNPIYELQDYKVSTEEELKKVDEDLNLLLAIRNMDANEMGALSMVLGDMNANLKSATENRWNLTALARVNPEKVREAMSNEKTKRKAKILVAINENIVEVNKLARLILWTNGNKICTYPVGEDAVDYLVTMSYLPEGEEVWQTICAKLNPAVPSDKKDLTPKVGEKSEAVIFVEMCLEEKALIRSDKGGWWSIGGSKKGDDGWAIHQGNVSSMVQYLKEHPEVKTILEEKVFVK